MLHRDISPARIRLGVDGWKLTEFGLDEVGTVRYMSPERCQGKPTDERSDIYSLGVVLYEAATGTVPFDAEMKFQIMDDHAKTPPPSPRAVNPELTDELEQVILKALAKSPQDRFQTATDFRFALEALLPEPERQTDSDLGPSSEAAAVVVEEAAAAPVENASSEVSYSPPTELPPAEPIEAEPAESWSAPRRVKLAPILVPVATIVVVIVGLLFLTGVIGGRKVPPVTGMGRADAERVLLGKGFRVQTDSTDDTLPAGTIVAQVPAAGENVPRSRIVELRVSTGRVQVPALAGLALADARQRLARLALTVAKVELQYSDAYGIDLVVSSKPKTGTKAAPRTSVGLIVSSGRATCPECGTRREARAMFCTKCGFKF
jgi:serine/threonine-protein kinase